MTDTKLNTDYDDFNFPTYSFLQVDESKEEEKADETQTLARKTPIEAKKASFIGKSIKISMIALGD
jgi:hypothetical protein